jgi:flagellar biosynthesis regulator FlbT
MSKTIRQKLYHVSMPFYIECNCRGVKESDKEDFEKHIKSFEDSLCEQWKKTIISRDCDFVKDLVSKERILSSLKKCDFMINITHTQIANSQFEERTIAKKAQELIDEHILLEHPESCYECKSCDKKFVRIKDTIKKRHNCSYKKTKLKKRLEKHFYPDINSIILGYIE